MNPTLGPGAAVLAFDVGGTTIKGALVGPDGVARGIVRVPTPPPGAACAGAVLDTVAQLALKLSALVADGARAGGAVQPAAVGIALPGVVDDVTGRGICSENLGWRDVDFAALARDRFALPVVIAHDVRSAGLAETTVGAARGADSALVVSLGTGIAAAVIVAGRPVVGNGYAGEIGHAVVTRGGEACRCGNQGCLEAIASAGAITRRYNRCTGAHVPGARDVVAAMHAGDRVAAAVWATATEALAFSLAQAVALIVPDVVVLAGGLVGAGDALFVPVRARLAELLAVTPPPPVVKATAGQDAGLLGAALGARRHLAARADALVRSQA
jgi:glucokinase